MNAWVLLAAAIVIEVAASMSLRAAVGGSRWWYVVVVGGYVTSFGLLAAVLAQGIPLGVAYGIWSATGVAMTAVLSRAIFKEAITPIMTAGIALIIGGVILVEVGARH